MEGKKGNDDIRSSCFFQRYTRGAVFGPFARTRRTSLCVYRHYECMHASVYTIIVCTSSVFTNMYIIFKFGRGFVCITSLIRNHTDVGRMVTAAVRLVWGRVMFDSRRLWGLYARKKQSGTGRGLEKLKKRTRDCVKNETTSAATTARA